MTNEKARRSRGSAKLLDELDELEELLAKARQAALDLLGALNSPERFTLDEWDDFNAEPIDTLFAAVMSALSITKEEVVTAAEERDRAFHADDES